MPNQLGRETSPYLLQHADNPVDWNPWSQEALDRAQAEDKPIFLSIGYSACHWCHVMAHESFEDEATAEIMNQHFVNIKVDREERPDLDQIYMSAVQMMTGGGGWPMSVFLTPDGAPFYGGTYFPPAPRHGLPSFRDVLRAVADAWGNSRQELERAGGRLVESLVRQAIEGGDAAEPLTSETLAAASQNLARQFDRPHGGWGSAPKFPQPMALEFLLRHHHLTGDALSLTMVTQTLEAMARGGMYDQIGGGFHRYSVDDHWLVPHFEKMLYDNGQLARVYLHAWQVTGNGFFRAIVEEILDYVVREMTYAGTDASDLQLRLRPQLPSSSSSTGTAGFYSTQDADSEGEEGKFFVWTPAEIRQVLGSDSGAFIVAYGVTESGNFEGKNILQFRGKLAERPALAEARRKLFEAREARVHPGRDEKVLTSWNGLMLAAFSEAARALGRADYQEVARRNADFVLRELRQENGRLFHSWKDGDARLNGYLEDYAYLIEGLLELYQATFEPRWFVAARELAETMLEHFADSKGMLYDTSDDHETLVTRPRDVQDNATPSGNAMAVTVLLKLAGFTHDTRDVAMAHRALAQMQPMISQYPLGFGQWLQALSFTLARSREIAIVGNPDSADTQVLLSVVRGGYRPFQVVALGAPTMQPASVPLLQDRGWVDGQAAAYVCRDFICQAPITDAQTLRMRLQ
jgi:uncharacterized protein YyaL (SSP411 family)